VVKKPGKVSLVGAGPGDWRLLTLGAKAALEEAEVVIYDRLVSERIIDFSKSTAEKIYVGKAASQHTLKQEEINNLIIEKALSGKNIVRLKGGDPFVFGRGGEEALACIEKGIPFEIIPGVTSAISAPAYAGIPVTHRNVAASFTVIAGHEDSEKSESSHRWQGLAQGADTLIFLMGVENLPQIQKKLLEHGKAPDTPVAFVRWGTHPIQETWTTTLADAVALREREKITAPAIFLVGLVVKLREKLAWFDRKPLFGKTVLVTRARAQASRLSFLLEEAGALTIETPMIEFAPPTSWKIVDRTIENLATYSWVIFTGVNGVEGFFERLLEKGGDARAFGSAKIAAIGRATAGQLLARGIRADLKAPEFKAESLLTAISSEISPGDSVLLIRPEEARNVLPKGLEALGVQVTIAPVYRTVFGKPEEKRLKTLLREGKIDWITFSSASMIQNLLTIIGSERELLKAVKIGAIGPITAAEAERNGLTVTAMPKVHTIADLVNAIVESEGKSHE